MSKDLTKSAVIIEGRKVNNFGAIVRTTLQHLPDDWGLIVIGPPETIDINKNQLYNVENVVYKEIDCMNSILDYNNLLFSLHLWETLLEGTSHVLIFQTDSALQHDGIEDFVKYDYIGAPCKDAKTMNGGLSLRRTQTMIDILKHHTPGKYENEDIFFSKHVPKIPISIQKRFSVECFDSTSNALGVHCTFSI